MMFSMLLTVLAASAAIASPLEARNDKKNNNNNKNSPSCPANQSAKCCRGMQQNFLNLIPVNVGIDCLDILGGSCNQQTACCTQHNNGFSVIQLCQLA